MNQFIHTLYRTLLDRQIWYVACDAFYVKDVTHGPKVWYVMFKRTLFGCSSYRSLSVKGGFHPQGTEQITQRRLPLSAMSLRPNFSTMRASVSQTYECT